jgi:hypothetical protein
MLSDEAVIASASSTLAAAAVGRSRINTKQVDWVCPREKPLKMKKLDHKNIGCGRQVNL